MKKTFLEWLDNDKSLNEEKETQYTILLLGGSIGGKSIRSVKHAQGLDIDADYLYDDKKDAKDKAKSLNKLLSPGEKKYYGMKYVPAESKDNKFTGK